MRNNSVENKDIIFVTILYIIAIIILVLLIITISNQKKTVNENLNNNSSLSSKDTLDEIPNLNNNLDEESD